MNSSRSFKLLFVIVAIVSVAGVANAVTVSAEGQPDEARVGEKVSATFVLSDLYDTYEQWSLNGSTELDRVTWTVQDLDLSGKVIQNGERSYDGESFSHPVSKDDDVAEVRVRVTGTVPEVENYTYAEREQFVFAAFDQTRQGGTQNDVATYETHYFTEESRQAREAIAEAEATVEDAGGNQQAERTLENAISAYNAGNFGNAVDLAEQAQATAKSANQRSQTIQLAIYVVVAVVVLAAIVGAVFWYRSGRTESKL